MTLPRDYDTWRLSGPDEYELTPVECPECHGTGMVVINCAADKCRECEGSGLILLDAEEYENERGDWLRDRRDGM